MATGLVTTTKYTVCTVYRSGSMILGRRGNIKQNFIQKFIFTSVMQWGLINFGSGTLSTNVLIKGFVKCIANS